MNNYNHRFSSVHSGQHTKCTDSRYRLEVRVREDVIMQILPDTWDIEDRRDAHLRQQLRIPDT